MRIAIICALTVLACSADVGPRYVSESYRFSMRELPGWTEKHDHGAVIFVRDRTTIAVKTADGKDPTRVIPATERYLASRPDATIL